MLTALGVIIGVASVIAMVSVGEGARKRISQQLEGMGTNNLVIRPGTITRGGVRAGGGTTSTLTLADAQAIQEIPGIVAVSPSVRAPVQALYRGRNWGTAVQGVTPGFIIANNWPVVHGTFFTDRHISGAEHVCTLGQTVVKELFGLADPLNEVIIVKGIACRIIGIMDEKGASAWGGDQDDIIMMPLTTVQRKILGITYIHHIEVQTASRETTYQAYTQINKLLRRRHRLQADQDPDYRIFNKAELAKTAEESARIFTWLLGSIASVALLVGGIGIMNIMLVSVTERTREIGIRMALGARRRDILWQFLVEALMLSSAGGIIGVMLGIGGGVLLAKFSRFPFSVTIWSVVLAFLFATIVGIFFGLHPARKAARLKPIDALHYE